MMYEYTKTQQVPNEPFRRWFGDEYFDLIIWYNTDESFYGFQLCYDRTFDERALTWKADKGFSHQKVDSGARDSLTPILVSDKTSSDMFDAQKIMKKFQEHSKEIDSGIVMFVSEKILDYMAEF